MASLLHRLGRWCSRHHWTTIGVWVALVAIVGFAAVAFSKPLTSEFSVPGSRFEAVLQDLEEAIPEAAGASGTVVFTSEGGFDAQERAAVEATVADWSDLDGVTGATNPFQTQQQLDAGQEQLAAAREELSAGQEQLDAAREELDAGQEQLAAAREELGAGRAQLEASAAQLSPQALAATEAELAAGEAEIAGTQEQLDTAREELAAGEAELAAAREQLAAGARLAALSEGLRFVSQDGTVALGQIQFAAAGSSLDPEVTAQVPEIGEQLAGTGVEVDYSQEIVQDLSNILGPGEVLGLVVAAVVLLVMLGSFVAAGLPLLMALVGVGVGLASALALTSVVQMNNTAPTLALMLGLAVGIDYSLFLINRHRTQLRAGMPIGASIALATGTSGNAVAFAGMTVVIALTALVVTGIPFLAVMGFVAAGTVVVSVLVALTLTPAVLSLVGPRVLSRRERRALSATPAPPTDGADRGSSSTPRGARHRPQGRDGWAGGVLRHPVVTVLGVLALVGFLAYPVTDLRLGLPDGSSEPPESTAYQTYDTVRDTFGAGVNGPIIAVAELDEPLPAGEETALTSVQADIGEDLAALPDVEYVLPFGLSQDRATLAFQMVPSEGPSAASTTELVQILDERGEEIGAANDATLGFTGQTVANIDISAQLADALPVYLAVVIGLSLLLLLLVFRSVVVPLLSTGGFLLSLGASFGVVVAVYQWGVLAPVFGVHETGPILSFLPILLIGVLFGLAMDYQLFLVSAMREAHVHGASAREAIVGGFRQSARVVVAAAIIMISVFGGFIFAELAIIRPVGLGLATGVLIDAFVVRMTLTPAVMGLLGERAWYLPRWLDRLLPDVDVEGAGLERHGTGSATDIPDRPARGAHEGEELATRA